ncbi:MAG: response regulator [Flavobacteriales bacterium]|nr:response regulator [Flavobacteriales bacterium]
MTPTIFIVEDDPFYQKLIQEELAHNKYRNVETFSNGKSCLENIDKNPDIVLLDYNLEGELNGLQVLQAIKNTHSNIEVIMLSAQEKLEVAANSIKYGAFDYVVKTDTAFKRIKLLVDRIAQWNHLIHENKRLKKLQFIALISIGFFFIIVFIISIYYPIYFD